MIVTHIDHYYVHWAKIFLMSIARNCPEEEVYISGANLSLEDIIQLREGMCTVKIANRRVECPIDQNECQIFMQCRVTQVLKEMWESGLSAMYIVSNADVMVRKSMDDLYLRLKDSDVLLHFTDEHSKIRQIQNGVIAFKTDNPAVGEFIAKYDEKVWEGGLPHRYDDQKVLYRLYNRFKDRVKFGRIPDSYVDGDFTKKAHMWSGHKHTRFKNYLRFREHIGLPRLFTQIQMGEFL